MHPTTLGNGPPRGAAVVRDVTEVGHVRGMPLVSRAVVATAMLDAVETPATIGQRLLVAPAGAVR